MDIKEKELLQRLLPLFKIEAGEHLKAISSGLIELEKVGPEKQQEVVEVIYREAHSLKGAARSVNLPNIAALCQSMEDVFSALKGREIQATTQLFDVLHKVVDEIGSLSTTEEEKADSGVGVLVQALENLSRKRSVAGPEARVEKDEELELTRQGSGRPFEPEPLEHPSPPLIPTLPAAETIRISVHKLDSILFQAEELLAVKIASGQRLAEIRGMRTSLNRLKKEWSGLKRPEEAFPLSPLDGRLTALLKSAEYDHRSLEGMVDSLLDEMKKVLLMPFSSISDVLPKFVRDLSRGMEKEVEMTVTGGEIEIDRRILEEMKDPLMHLIRNCLDHGIEKVEERKRKKKASSGKIELVVRSKNGNKLEISVSDDGAGIDPSAIKSAALRTGIFTREEAEKIGDQDALSLIFHSGLTTSPIITDISGRGLGLAIVREKVERLNGLLSVDTNPDEGTTFRIVIPVTLATFRGVLVRVGEQTYILPTINVERTVRIKKEEIKTVENRETVLIDSQVLSFIRMGEVLGIKSGVGGQGPGTGIEGAATPRPPTPDPFLSVVVLGSGEKRMAFEVDEVLQEREVLLKPLGRQLSRVRNFVGATVLEGGKVIPVLNISDILKSAVRSAAASKGLQNEITREKRKSILVAEDSITARTLLKNILTNAGYDVKTAVDGVEAVSALRTQSFDLVVSDVQMPRMDGFDLVENIRKDKNLSELPVVLVTGLESRDDRRRGIEVGANAYIVKSSFDQSNLLEVIGRLI